jgi:hypothetical protein
MSDSHAARPDWAEQVRHIWSTYFNGSASPQFISTLVVLIGVGILIGVSLGGSAPAAPAISSAERQAEERSILHIEELSAKSAALEARGQR